MDIRGNLDSILKGRSLTMPMLALKLGMSYNNLYQQIVKPYPNFQLLCRISEELGVGISELIEGPVVEGEEVVIHCPHCGGEMRLEVKV